MITAIERVCQRRKPKTCLDVFSGTGSLANVAVANGVRHVDCVESNSLLPQYLNGRVSLRDGADAWTFRPQRSYDLVVLDPFYDWALRAARELLPHLMRRTKWFVFNVGYSYDRYWTDLVRKEIGRVAGQVRYIHGYENLVAVGSWP
jgi:16S rRNA G966 N2-methylase RsmD